MKVIDPKVEIMTPLGPHLYQQIEDAARTCYQSFDFVKEGSAERMVKQLLTPDANGQRHEAMIEMADVALRITCDRGVSHELVRHRLASYAQESTRYCNYSGKKFGGELTFIRPCFWDKDSAFYHSWEGTMLMIEQTYNAMTAMGASPQEARSVLPNSLKTEIVMKMDVREWRHFLRLRTGSRAHPQMRQVAWMIYDLFKDYTPLFVEDIPDTRQGNKESE